jgi:hypothetical protein
MPRPRRRTPKKPDARAKARWYAARGYPHAYIALKVGATRNTVRKWCVTYEANRVIDRLVMRLRMLPESQRRELFSRVLSASRADASTTEQVVQP